MYTAMDLSRYIISKCINDKKPISNLQLQKILYYIQKEYLSRDELAFSDEIEAWQFGPVVPNVYYHYCGYGSMPITNPSTKKIIIDESDEAIIDSIVAQKRELDPWVLVEETHKPNGAWAKIYKNGEGNHRVIPTDLIRKAG